MEIKFPWQEDIIHLNVKTENLQGNTIKNQ